MRKYTNIEKFLDDAILFNLKNENVTTILDAELAEEFLTRLEDEYVCPEVEICDDFEDGCVFGIDKIENSDGDISIYVYDIYDREDGELVDLENDFIFIQKGLLDELEMDTVYFEEALIIADLSECEDYDFEEYDDSFDNENEDLEEKCTCDCCQCGESYEDEEECEFVSDLVSLVESTLESLEDSCGCTDCKRLILMDLVSGVLDITQKYDYEEDREEPVEEELTLDDVLSAISDAWKTLSAKDRNKF